MCSWMLWKNMTWKWRVSVLFPKKKIKKVNSLWVSHTKIMNLKRIKKSKWEPRKKYHLLKTNKASYKIKEKAWCLLRIMFQDKNRVRKRIREIARNQETIIDEYSSYFIFDLELGKYKVLTIKSKDIFQDWLIIKKQILCLNAYPSLSFPIFCRFIPESSRLFLWFSRSHHLFCVFGVSYDWKKLLEKFHLMH